MKRFLIFAIIFVMSFSSVFAFFDAEDDEIVELDDVVEVVGNAQGLPAIQATSVILYDRTSKRILYEKNSNKKVPNASTTKVLTAIVACENANLNDIVNISKEAANATGSSVDFRAGDKVGLSDLLIGLLLRSGNDAAVAIAEYVGGSVDDFCQMMNEKAKEIGAWNTNFTSPHGLDDDEHYSTAYDLAIISDYALNIPFIANTVCRKNAKIKINDYYRELNSTNEMLSFYPGANGIKTGFTGNAGRCLITSATKNNWQLISVVLGCNTKKQRTQESIQLLNYGFDNYSLIDICERMKTEFTVNVNKSKNGSYTVATVSQFFYPLTSEELEKINYKYNFNKNLEAPISKGAKIGEINVMLDDSNICNLDVTINQNIERKNLADFFFQSLKALSDCYR